MLARRESWRSQAHTWLDRSWFRLRLLATCRCAAFPRRNRLRARRLLQLLLALRRHKPLNRNQVHVQQLDFWLPAARLDIFFVRVNNHSRRKHHSVCGCGRRLGAVCLLLSCWLLHQVAVRPFDERCRGQTCDAYICRGLSGGCSCWRRAQLLTLLAASCRRRVAV